MDSNDTLEIRVIDQPMHYGPSFHEVCRGERLAVADPETQACLQTG